MENSEPHCALESETPSVSESSPVAQPNAGETDDDSVNVEKQDSPPFLVSVTLKLLRFLT